LVLAPYQPVAPGPRRRTFTGRSGSLRDVGTCK
jgi:hypothetical protein